VAGFQTFGRGRISAFANTVNTRVINVNPGAAATFDVSPDGTRMLLIRYAEADNHPRLPSIVLIQNWFEELKRLVPVP
jgi:hypothetical protein